MFENNELKEYQLLNGASGKSVWASPSNIALVKYWGKKTGQYPRNPNVSFSLSGARTITEIFYSVSNSGSLSWNFLFEGKPFPEFDSKIKHFFGRISPFLPFLSALHLEINSRNTFPHSAGIASSASAMSSLALGLNDISYELRKIPVPRDSFHSEASFLARLGSGSASRSIYKGFSVWGETDLIPESSDEFAVPLGLKNDSFFNHLKDAVLIVSSKKKEISSSTGHALMDTNPFADQRYRMANHNLAAFIHALQTEDKQEFIDITEHEALTLHGLMMSSLPGYLLLQNGSMEIIRKIREFRKKQGVFITFTLDAGPNVHVLYHEDDHVFIKDFIHNELLQFTEQGKVIWDCMGEGPEKVSFFK